MDDFQNGIMNFKNKKLGFVDSGQLADFNPIDKEKLRAV